MIIYSVYITIQQTASAAWLKFMQQKHLNDVMQTGCFVSCQMLKQTESGSDNAEQYVIQYSAESMEKLQYYLDRHALRLRQDVVVQFGDSFTAQRRIYEVISTM
ncbi:MAG: DUF4286 family protein [Sphingobacteriales bacterium]|nr:DUF4286 family protein [Sphingobacteriales bacterium]